MNKRGFTLTELLITAMVMGLAVTSIFTFFYNMNYTFQSQEHAADLQQQARYAIQRMEWLIKQAGSGDAKGMTVVSGINGVPNDSLSFKITRGPKTMILDNKFWPSNNKIKVLNAKGFKPKQQVSMIDLMSDMYRSIDILTVEAVNEQDNIITFLSPGKNLWLSSSFGLFADVTTATISTFGTNVQISYSDQDDPEILLDNVENLQFVFHLDDSDPGDGEVDICYNVIFDSSVSSRCSEKTIHTVASFDQNSAVSNPLKAPVINAVEIHLLVKYPQEEGKIKSVSHTFRIGDVVRNFNDGHQRRLVKQTVRLRNAALLE